MNKIIESENKDYNIFSYSASVVIHSVLLIICIIVFNHQDNSSYGKGIDVQIVSVNNLDMNSEESHISNAPSENIPLPMTQEKEENPGNQPVISDKQIFPAMPERLLNQLFCHPGIITLLVQVLIQPV